MNKSFIQSLKRKRMIDDPSLAINHSMISSYRFESDFEQLFHHHHHPISHSQQPCDSESSCPTLAQQQQHCMHNDSSSSSHVCNMNHLPCHLILHICSYLIDDEETQQQEEENAMVMTMNMNDDKDQECITILLHLKLLNRHWYESLCPFQWTDTEEICLFNMDRMIKKYHLGNCDKNSVEGRAVMMLHDDNNVNGNDSDNRNHMMMRYVERQEEIVETSDRNDDGSDSKDDTSPGKKRRIARQHNVYRTMGNRSFLRRYSQRPTNASSISSLINDCSIIDLTEEDVSDGDADRGPSAAVANMDETAEATNKKEIDTRLGDVDGERAVEEDPDIIIMSDDDDEKNIEGSEGDEKWDRKDSMHSDKTTCHDACEEHNNSNALIDVSLEMNDDTNLLSDDDEIANHIADTTPQKQKNVEHLSDDHIRIIRSSVLVLRFNREFEIELTEPFWTLRIIDRSAGYVLDPSKPIFSVNNFLKILRFFQSNPSKLMCSKIPSLDDLFPKLKPFTSVFFSSEREAEYFISQVDSILYPKEDSVLKLGNLSFLILQYIQHYKHWFEEKPQRIPNFIKQPGSYECRESGAVMKKLLRCKPKDKVIVLEVEQFPIYDDVFNYPHSDIINTCIDSLSILSFPYDEGTFNGDVNCRTGLPEGFGSWISETKTARYDGFWVNGEKCGEGTYTTDEFKYNGEWMHNLFHGEGELLFTSGEIAGSVYRGQFGEGRKNGHGMQFYKQIGTPEVDLVRWDDGKLFNAWYRGLWKNEERWGMGEYRTKTSWKYGLWRRDELYDGIGMVTDSSDKRNYAIVIENYHVISRKCVVPKNFLSALQDDGSQNKYDLDSIMEQYLNGTVTSPLIAPKRVLWAGYCFRSRLEARWSIFLEYMKIDYVYEPRTFHLPNGHKYTPDFYLPSRKIWLEIKPTYPTEEEREKAQLLARESSIQGHRVLLIYGSVYPPFVRKHYEGAKAIEFLSNGQQIEPMAWTQCKSCEKIDLGLRCQPSCHPDLHDGSVEPSPGLRIAFEYVNKIDFDQLSKAQIDPTRNEIEGVTSSTLKSSRYF